MKAYWRLKNTKSIDGLPSLVDALEYRGRTENMWMEYKEKKRSEKEAREKQQVKLAERFPIIQPGGVSTRDALVFVLGGLSFLIMAWSMQMFIRRVEHFQPISAFD